MLTTDIYFRNPVSKSKNIFLNTMLKTLSIPSDLYISVASYNGFYVDP